MINSGTLNGATLNGSASGGGGADWVDQLDPLRTQVYYALVLTGAANGVSDVRLPMSSWQATNQRDRAVYLRAVVPAATDHLDEIDARSNGELVVYRGARYEDGTTDELEMLRVPLEQATVDRGPRRETASLSGYGAPSPSRSPGTQRTLAGVRTLSTGNGTRSRSDVDWLLRPGNTAVAEGELYEVDYINYYCTPTDEYMDVGTRG